MWESLYDICNREGTSVNEVVSFVEKKVVSLHPACPNLTSSVRAFIANYFRAAATEEGHRLAGQGCGEPLKGAMLEPTTVGTSDEGMLNPEAESIGLPGIETRGLRSECRAPKAIPCPHDCGTSLR